MKSLRAARLLAATVRDEFGIHDVLGIAGFGCLVYGAWMIHPPYGWLVAGALLLSAAVIGSRR